jgi:hypothetical protein
VLGLGTQTSVTTSCVSPSAHATAGAEGSVVNAVKADIAGATVTATANPPARISRRAGNRNVATAITGLSVVCATAYAGEFMATETNLPFVGPRLVAPGYLLVSALTLQ